MHLYDFFTFILLFFKSSGNTASRSKFLDVSAEAEHLQLQAVRKACILCLSTSDPPRL
uniref:Uncharacterized protein n=1 Tax=Anguilla anguilla TaxID=7936 RepID=A0A0E9PT67_ANGAN